MCQSNKYAVYVQEMQGSGAQYLVTAATPSQAVELAMTESGEVGHGSGLCLCSVYDAVDDGHFPAGSVLLEVYATADCRTGKITIK
ncbi:MAG: hypothetical protein V4719_00755 [Planctomycetota bacterium]